MAARLLFEPVEIFPTFNRYMSVSAKSIEYRVDASPNVCTLLVEPQSGLISHYKTEWFAQNVHAPHVDICLFRNHFSLVLNHNWYTGTPQKGNLRRIQRGVIRIHRISPHD